MLSGDRVFSTYLTMVSLVGQWVGLELTNLTHVADSGGSVGGS